MFKLYDNKSSLDIKRGRYNCGGKTDAYQKRLGWWERDLSFMRRQIDDVTFVITPEYAHRVDLISQKLYNRPDFEWLILQYNNIVDINEEIVVGKILYAPSPSRAFFDITI